MELSLITREDFFPEETMLVKTFLKGGLDWLHLRKSGSSPEQYRAFLEALTDEQLGRVVLHEHYSLAEELPVGGIHANSRSPFPSRLPRRLSLSASCHSLEELAAKRENFDRLFLSPVFDSISKHGYKAAFSPDELLAGRRSGIIGSNITALGGICAENIHIIKELGFGGAAVLGSVWNSPSPQDAFNEILAACRAV